MYVYKKIQKMETDRMCKFWREITDEERNPANGVKKINIINILIFIFLTIFGKNAAIYFLSIYYNEEKYYLPLLIFSNWNSNYCIYCLSFTEI